MLSERGMAGRPFRCAYGEAVSGICEGNGFLFTERVFGFSFEGFYACGRMISSFLHLATRLLGELSFMVLNTKVLCLVRLG